MADAPTKKDSTARISTRFEGVYQRASTCKRYKGRADICYIIDYYDQQTGKRVRKTIGFKSEGITAELAAGLRRDLISASKKKAAMGELYTKPSKELLLGQAWEIYKKDWLEGRAKTLATDSSIIEKHLKSIASLKLSAITAHKLTSLMAELGRKGLAPQTVRHVVALIRRIMRKMVQWKLWQGEMPFADIEMPTLNNSRTRYLTPQEAHTLLDALKENTPRMWAMALVSLHCGLRFGEIANLTVGDIDHAAQIIHVRESKSGKARQAVMSSAVAELFRSIAHGRNADIIFMSRAGKVMLAPSQAFEKVVEKLGFNVGIADRRQRVVFHTLRHTYASWLAMAGEGQSMIADLLGHSSLEMSRRYTHLMPDARKATARVIDAVFKHDAQTPE